MELPPETALENVALPLYYQSHLLVVELGARCAPGSVAWIDEVAMDPQQIGCAN